MVRAVVVVLLVSVDLAVVARVMRITLVLLAQWNKVARGVMVLTGMVVVVAVARLLRVIPQGLEALAVMVARGQPLQFPVPQ